MTKGLSNNEVLKSRELHGSNKLPEPKMKKWYDFAKEALSEKITLILMLIAVVQLVLAFMGVMEFSEPIMIMVVLGIVTAISVKTGLGVQKSAAELRLNNPDMSLNELSSLSGISKSGLNHRLNRLIELAKEYKS